MTDYNASSAKEVFPKGVMGDVSLAASYSIATNLPAADRVKMFSNIPAGVKILDATMELTDIDTHATPEASGHLLITDGTTSKDLIGSDSAPSTIGQGGGIARMDQPGQGFNFVTTNGDFEVFYVVKVDAATFAAGTLKVRLVVTPYLINGA